MIHMRFLRRGATGSPEACRGGYPYGAFGGGGGNGGTFVLMAWIVLCPEARCRFLNNRPQNPIAFNVVVRYYRTRFFMEPMPLTEAAPWWSFTPSTRGLVVSPFRQRASGRPLPCTPLMDRP